MENKLIELRIYQDSQGQSAFSDWLRGLPDRQARARIRVRLDRFSLGNPGDVKALGDGVYELRIDYAVGYRVYFGYDGPLIVLLLIAGTKKT